jgi:hypothetical protein
MKFSVKKTFHLKIGKVKNNFTYKLNGENISTSETLRDLGITVDSKLSFESHISKVVKAANIRQYNLFRIIPKKLPTDLKILAYKTYVRPILEYATEVYNPYKIYLKKRLEKPQRTFTKFDVCCSYPSYRLSVFSSYLSTLFQVVVVVVVAAGFGCPGGPGGQILHPNSSGASIYI